MKFFLVFLLSIHTLTAAINISPFEAFNMVKENKAVLIDVREIEELKQGMAKDALILPLSLINSEEFEERIQTLPMEKTLILYCRSGRRADKMGLELTHRGFNVLNMGGFDSWRAAGLPLTQLIN